MDILKPTRYTMYAHSEGLTLLRLRKRGKKPRRFHSNGRPLRDFDGCLQSLCPIVDMKPKGSCGKGAKMVALVLLVARAVRRRFNG